MHLNLANQKFLQIEYITRTDTETDQTDANCVEYVEAPEIPRGPNGRSGYGFPFRVG